MIERVYDEYGRLQCKTCKEFYPSAAYYQHNTPTGRYAERDDHICKHCYRTSAVAETCRANARHKYATNAEHRTRQIAKATERYYAKRDEINCRKRAIWLAKKYGDAINKLETQELSE